MTDEWWEGYMDYKNGEDVNPFPILSEAWYDWEAGWEAAESE